MSSPLPYHTNRPMYYQNMYKHQGMSWNKDHLMDACIKIPYLNVLPKRTKRQNSYKSKNGIIDKKELVVMLEKLNVQLPALGLGNNTPNAKAPYNSIKFPNLKEMDCKVVNTELDSSSEFLDKTMLNLDSLCQSDTITAAPFWYDELEPIPILEVSHEDNFLPILNLNNATPSKILPTNSSSATIELTPPSSTTCDSIVSCSISDSEDSFAENFAYLESPEQENLASKDDTLTEQVRVAIEPFEPSLCQLQDLYRRKKNRTAACFRERCLRPRNSLRQFTPFMIEAPLHKKHRKNLLLKKGQNSHKGHKNQSSIKTKASCQTQLFLNAKQDQLKRELEQKKQAMMFRKKFENALDSINKRIFRQSHFWKMLPS